MAAERGFYRSILDNLYDGVYFVDAEGRITYWNEGAERISGYAREQVRGKRCSDNLLMHVSEDGTALCLADCPVKATLLDGKLREAEVYLQHADGYRVPVLARVTPMLDSDARIVGCVEVFSDNTVLSEARRQLGELERETVTDALTSVWNRRYIEARLKGLLFQAQQFRSPLGVMFIDVDHFKMVNDTHGHAVGDSILRTVASTLSRALRAADLLGRWGGEEFVAIADSGEPATLERLANKLRALVEMSKLNVPGAEVSVTVSIGATISRPEDTSETLVARADELMYESKLGGRNRVTLG